MKAHPSLQMRDEGPKYGFGVIGVSVRKLLAAAEEGKSCTESEQALKVLEHSEALTPHLVGEWFALASSGSSNRPQHQSQVAPAMCVNHLLLLSCLLCILDSVKHILSLKYPISLMLDESCSYPQGLLIDT